MAVEEVMVLVLVLQRELLVVVVRRRRRRRRARAIAVGCRWFSLEPRHVTIRSGRRREGRGRGGGRGGGIGTIAFGIGSQPRRRAVF